MNIIVEGPVKTFLSLLRTASRYILCYGKHVLLTVIFSFTISSLSASELISFTSLPESPEDFFIKSAEQKKQIGSQKITLAKGEGEFLFFAYRPNQNSTSISLFVEADNHHGISVKFYRIGWVMVKMRWGNKKKLDPLFPIQENQPFPCLEPTWFAVRLSTKLNTIAGEYNLKIGVIEQGVKNYFPVTCNVLDFNLPDSKLSIQGALGNVLQLNKKTRIFDAYRLLKQYGINSAAVSPGLIGQKNEFLRSLINENIVNRARINHMPSAHNVFKNNQSDYLRKEYVYQLVSKIKNEKFSDHQKKQFHVKLWDEPTKKNLSLVRDLYNSIEKFDLPILTELAGISDQADIDLADIQVVRLRHLDKEFVKKAHALGKEIWVYANPMHSLNRPYHAMRNIGWLIWYLNADGYHFWDVSRWKRDPLKNIVDRDSFWGRGFFLYFDDKHGWIPSLRLAFFKEGLEDYQLLHLLSSVSVVEEEKIRNYVSDTIKFKRSRKIYTFNATSIRRDVLNKYSHIKQ